jgi:hypothetical protein
MAELTPNTDFFQLLNIYDVDDLQDILSSIGVKINKCQDGRVHFEVNLFDTSHKPHRVRYQARGLVIDSLEKKFLSIPPYPAKYIDTIKLDDVRKAFNEKQYNVIEAYDGTNITIYQFNGETYASSAKSPDISNYYWQGNETFSEMIFGVATKTNPEFIKDSGLKLSNEGNLSWNIPDEYCVTLGFRHHNIHPDKSDPEAVWLVRCVNRDTLLDEELPQLASLKRNKVVSEVGTFDELLATADRDITINHKEKLYGYILRPKNHIGEQVFIPSSLYKLYQHFFYSVERNKDDEIKHHNRYIYSICRNLLSNNNNYLKVLCKLIPEYYEEMEKINVFLDTIVSRLLARIYDDTVFIDTIYTDFLDKIIQEVKVNEPDLNIKSIEASKLLTDYVRSIENTYALTEIYLKE